MAKWKYNRHVFTAISILVITYIIYGFTAQHVILNSRTWLDEVTYLIKSFNYVSGNIQPYSDQDPTWYMPVYFYELGAWQYLIGKGMSSARLLSSLVGAASGLVLYDVVRRITGNSLAAALSTLVFLTIPSICFYFNTAIPASSVSFLLISTVWVIVRSTEDPSWLTTLAFGFLLATLYLYRQNMVLAVIVLLPVYILKIRKNRLKHIALVTTGITLVIVSTLIVFSDRLLIYAMRLPLLTPVLSELGFMSNTLYTIENGTTSDLTLSVPLANIDFADILDGFILPYAGLILSALISILLARDKLKVLLIIPGFFLFLSVTHYLGSLGYCSTCILPYTSYYAVIGAMCFGVSIAILSQKNKHKPLQNFIICGSLTISVIIMNYLSSGLATRTEYKFYPTAMFKNDRPIAEKEETEQLAAFIKKHTDPTSQILPIHNLITIPYAIFLAERSLPPQGINLKHSYRSIKSNLSDIKKERTIKALQYEGLWSDEILEIWLAKTYNTIIFQMDPRPQSSRLKEKIELNFVKTASTGHRGYNVHIYHRAHNQQQHNTE